MSKDEFYKKMGHMANVVEQYGILKKAYVATSLDSNDTTFLSTQAQHTAAETYVSNRIIARILSTISTTNDMKASSMSRETSLSIPTYQVMH